jgi:hypothetical protein
VITDIAEHITDFLNYNKDIDGNLLHIDNQCFYGGSGKD